LCCDAESGCVVITATSQPAARAARSRAVISAWCTPRRRAEARTAVAKIWPTAPRVASAARPSTYGQPAFDCGWLGHVFQDLLQSSAIEGVMRGCPLALGQLTEAIRQRVDPGLQLVSLGAPHAQPCRLDVRWEVGEPSTQHVLEAGQLMAACGESVHQCGSASTTRSDVEPGFQRRVGDRIRSRGL
jgi:hypothetical protein